MTGVRRALALTAVGILLASGCAGPTPTDADPPSGSAESPTSVSTSPTTADPSSEAREPVTDADLRRAVPSTEQVPGASGVDFRCPDAAHAEVCSFARRGAPALALAISYDLAGGGQAQLYVARFDRPAAAAAAAARRSRESRGQAGLISTQAVDTGGGSYRPGLRGSGAVDAVELEGWTGTQLERHVAFVQLDGTISDGLLQDATIDLRRGPILVRVFVTMASRDVEDSRARRLATRLAGDYVTRLAS